MYQNSNPYTTQPSVAPLPEATEPLPLSCRRIGVCLLGLFAILRSSRILVVSPLEAPDSPPIICRRISVPFSTSFAPGHFVHTCFTKPNWIGVRFFLDLRTLPYKGSVCEGQGAWVLVTFFPKQLGGRRGWIPTKHLASTSVGIQRKLVRKEWTIAGLPKPARPVLFVCLQVRQHKRLGRRWN